MLGTYQQVERALESLRFFVVDAPGQVRRLLFPLKLDLFTCSLIGSWADLSVLKNPLYATASCDFTIKSIRLADYFGGKSQATKRYWRKACGNCDFMREGIAIVTAVPLIRPMMLYQIMAGYQLLRPSYNQFQYLELRIFRSPLIGHSEIRWPTGADGHDLSTKTCTDVVAAMLEDQWFLLNVAKTLSVASRPKISIAGWSLSAIAYDLVSGNHAFERDLVTNDYKRCLNRCS